MKSLRLFAYKSQKQKNKRFYQVLHSRLWTALLFITLLFLVSDTPSASANMSSSQELHRSQTFSTNSMTTIYLTDSGFKPDQVIIQPNSTIIWINQTDQTWQICTKNSYYQVFLPLISGSTNASETPAQLTTSYKFDPQTSGQTDSCIIASIPPGGSYNLNFDTLGTFSFFLIGRSEISSTVVVDSSPPSGQMNERLIGSYVKPQDINRWCTNLQYYNARFTWMTVPWNLVEPEKGHFTWSELDAVVQSANTCGLDIGFHILSRSSWATLPPPQNLVQKTPSMPPKDMSDYYNFVFSLASRYAGKVSRYSIENEAHSTNNWASTPEAYFELLATGYEAVKAADPNALVENDGLSSSGLGIMIVNDLINAGRMQEASDFFQRYYAHYAPSLGEGEPIIVGEIDNLPDLLNQPEVQRVLTWGPQLFAHQSYYDVIQLHYFGPWQAVPVVMKWIRNNLEVNGQNTPIEFWEFGLGWDNVNTYDSQYHAVAEGKYLATAIGEGALRVLIWQFTDYAAPLGHPGLMTAAGPRPAAAAFRVAANKLNGTVNSTRLMLDPSVWAYRYETSNGQTVYAVWSTRPIRISLPIEAQTVVVTNISGESTTADPRFLDVGDSPIFVEIN